MSEASDLRASLIQRGFISSPSTNTVPQEPLNEYRRQTITSRFINHDEDPSAASFLVDVYEDRFTGPVVVYSRDGVKEGRNGEQWQLPPLKNQWMHDWRGRVANGQPTVRLRAPRWAYYGEIG